MTTVSVPRSRHPSPQSTVDYLASGITRLREDIEATAFWSVMTSPATDPELIRAVMKEVYLEIHWYQPDVIEATMAVIGQFPRTLAAKRVRTMLIHQAEEWDHGEMARRDFLGLGGTEDEARTSRMSPTAFATAAFWRMLAHKREPFAYLGALYLFEGLTPLVTAAIKEPLKAKGLTDDTLEYIEFHSTEDIKHAKIVDHLIDETVQAFPESAEAIRFGFEAFLQVYPLPGWSAAYNRGLAAFRASAEAA
ncbi:MAG: iron-containing redox enzyme family protein [Gemmatimonadales bacterium]